MSLISSLGVVYKAQSRYWDGIIQPAKVLKSLIAADREGDWDGHLQAIQDLLPVFYASGSVNYLRYA